MATNDATDHFFAHLGRPYAGDELFDHVPDTVYFIKDSEGRYVAVNQTLVERCGCQAKDDLLGQTARDVFPPPLGESFSEQDLEVIAKGRSIREQLERHLYPNGAQGWCLTWKEPILDASGSVSGIAGISRDLDANTESIQDLDSVSGVLVHIRDHLDSSLRLAELAEMAQLSTYQLDQRIRALFGLTAGQYITRCRIEQACHLLERTDQPISLIALDCGYADQSAFTRQFRQSVGLTPGAFRDRRDHP